ncbi:MAG: N-acetyltransferase [Campylobacterota bacterium]|nr:N-acetyltransferase [Campylobacterota bacterium]
MSLEITLQKPDVLDIKNMQDLVLKDVENGNILERNSSEIATTIRSYVIAKHDNKIVGFAALHIHTDELAEIRSLVVDENLRGQGVGKKLINSCIDEAKELKLIRILVLTYQAKLFSSFGFDIIEKESIPETKIWADCIKCKHFPICDEIALMKVL